MIIRPYQDEDFDEVIELLKLCKVEPPAEESDFAGLCYVALDQEKLIGCIWALLGVSTQGYVDYFAVHPKYRSQHIGWALLQMMEQSLQKMGIKRFTFFLDNDDAFLPLVEKYVDEYNLKRLNILHWFRRTF